MNKEKLIELANLLETVRPENFNMGAWFGKIIEAEQDEEYEYYADCIEPDEEIASPYSYPNLNDIIKVSDQKDTIKLSCGTTACIAGWTIINEFSNNRLDLTKHQIEALGAETIEVTARDILGLTHYQAERLFFCNDNSLWMEIADDYNLDYVNPDYAQTWNINPKVVAEVLKKIANEEIEFAEC